MEFLNGSYLFKSMFKDDPEAEMLHCVPGVAPLLKTYPFFSLHPCKRPNNNPGKSLLEFLKLTLTFEHHMVELCMQLFEIGLAEHKRRETEVSSFFSGQTNAVTDSQQKASHILAKFEQHHKEVSCVIFFFFFLKKQSNFRICSGNLYSTDNSVNLLLL